MHLQLTLTYHSTIFVHFYISKFCPAFAVTGSNTFKYSTNKTFRTGCIQLFTIQTDGFNYKLIIAFTIICKISTTKMIPGLFLLGLRYGLHKVLIVVGVVLTPL